MRRLPSLHSLRAFEGAARHRHFAHAADELGLTPTAISHQVRQLEEVLGLKLFHRYPRPIRLTEAGARLFPVLRDSLDRIAAALTQLTDSVEGTPLRLSLTVAFASRWLMPRLADLRQQTGVSTTVEADDGLADLHASGVDVAIRYAETPTTDAEWHLLFPDRFVAVSMPGLVREGLTLSAAEVLALPLLHYRWRTGSAKAPNWPHWQSLAEGSGKVPALAQIFSEEIHAIDAAVAGQGVVLASEVLVAGLLRSELLVRLSDVALPAPSYWFVFLPSNPSRHRIMKLLRWFRQHR